MSKIQIFELFGTILLKDQGVEGKLDKIEKKAGGTAKSMGMSFGTIAGAALKLGAVLGVGLGFKDMIEGATKSQERLAQMDNVLKSTGGQAGMTKDELLKLADAQGKLTKFSKGANIETENLLLTFTGIGKKTFPDALKAVNDMSTALGQDTKSSAIQLGKALNDPIKGITALSKVGVSFTEEQKKQIKVLQESGKTEQAQAVILKELQKEFEGSAEAAGAGFGGQLTILKNQLSGVSTQMGTTLLPYLQNFTKYINDNMPVIKQAITDVVNYVIPKFQEWSALIGEIAKELLPSFGKSTDDAKTKATDLAKDGMNFVTDALKWIKDNIGIVKDGVIALTTVWILEKIAVLALNIAQGAHNISLVAGRVATVAMNVVTAISTALQWGHAIALESGSVALGVIAAAQWLFNIAMDANPIGVVVIALAALGLAIYEVVKHWQDIVTWISKAWDWLTKWNGTPAQDKNATVTTTNVAQDAPANIPGYNAAGTDNWRGGLTWVGEKGPELINAPKGTRIKSNDESMAMVNGGSRKSSQPVILQLVLQNGKAIAEYLIPDLDILMGSTNRLTGRAVGV